MIFPDRKFVAELTHDIPSIFKVTSGDGDICVSGDGSDFRMDVVNIGRVIVKEQNSIVSPFSVVQTDFDWNFSGFKTGRRSAFDFSRTDNSRNT